MKPFAMKTYSKSPIIWFLLLLTTTIILPISCRDSHENYSQTTNVSLMSNDLITTMCQKTPYPSSCETRLRSDPRSSTADSKSLILIMIDVIKSRFSDSFIHARDMSKSTTDPKMSRALKECMACYSAVTDADVKSAIYFVQTGDPKFALQAMYDAGIEADSCQREFQGDVPPFFVDRTRELKEISAIAAALVQTMF
ncbi:hypothetical protein RND81_13G066500 [Saponaria officinalis]|uniref:Pectinesterase inhibitor domain-containing protein n=1 Tax=Saponaria officinalis TaxID=3572 RepID=A0AAW1GXT7_SAPOF